MIKVNEAGGLEWDRTLGGTGFEAGQAVIESHDGGFFMVGNSKSQDQDLNKNRGENDIWVVKTDAKGQLVWQRSFGGEGLDFAFDVAQQADGSLLVVGHTDGNSIEGTASKGGMDAVLLKVE
jgi:hypothetical protein